MPVTNNRAAVIAGVGILLLAALGPIGLYFNTLAAQGGGSAGTASGLIGSETVFRLGIAGLCAAVVVDVLIAWALYHLFRPLNDGVALLAAWSRLAYSAIFLIAIAQLPGVARLVSDGVLPGLDQPERHAQALLGLHAFGDLWNAGFVLFGLHLVLIGYLTYRCTFLPRFLGVLLVAAGLGYAFDSVVAVLAPDFPITIGVVTFIGELLLGVWLLLRTRRPVVRRSPHAEEPVATR